MTPCVLHRGSTNNCGYGQVRRGNKTLSAHVVAWTDVHGPVPPGLEVSHLCHVPLCIEPTHLIVETHAENMARARWMACAKGHSDWTTRMVHGKPRRRCRPCHADWERARKARRRVSA